MVAFYSSSSGEAICVYVCVFCLRFVFFLAVSMVVTGRRTAASSPATNWYTPTIVVLEVHTSSNTVLLRGAYIHSLPYVGVMWR